MIEEKVLNKLRRKEELLINKALLKHLGRKVRNSDLKKVNKKYLDGLHTYSYELYYTNKLLGTITLNQQLELNFNPINK